MNNEECTIDIRNVIKMFAEFDERLRKKTFKTALTKSANILKKQALSNLSSIVKDVNKVDKWGNSFKKGITVKVSKKGMAAKVHIMKNFKLKFFELGTDERETTTFRRKKLKKVRYTGKIKAYKFFTLAQQQAERQCFDSLQQHLIDVITRINKKGK